MSITVGVLALQGGFYAHEKALHACNVNALPIRKPEQVNNIDALIIPGGESSSLLKLMTPLNFIEAICSFSQKKKPVLGTCAGMILLAKQIEPEQTSLQLMDITVERNAYGRQRDSFIGEGQCDPIISKEPIECVFIRAPKIKSQSNHVKTLITCNDEAVMVQQDHLFAASFHPELSSSLNVHAYFVKHTK